MWNEADYLWNKKFICGKEKFVCGMNQFICGIKILSYFIDWVFAAPAFYWWCVDKDREKSLAGTRRQECWCLDQKFDWWIRTN
ncbi:hypothetical protein BBI15_14935 [Planococcus plakortidis]|uniref:Uncharacterized protein n=1 Tax=Planococcus plakortidis TaxID=1038856 RepID=A0A1C7ECA5_9BACL|nr:hypothetical protein [Planococcus plakortidis]ANU21379.1 hypothetical protein BBI15_14935 [Planococcus plakortidis]